MRFDFIALTLLDGFNPFSDLKSVKISQNQSKSVKISQNQSKSVKISQNQ